MATLLQNKKYQSCIDASNTCFEACEYCVSECCLHADDIKSMVNVFNFVVTAQIYVFYLHNISYRVSNKICGQCADICESCAVECDKFDMDMCKQCAQVCRACASECRKMAV